MPDVSEGGKFCNVAGMPVNEGLACFKRLVQNETLRGARRGHAVAFGAVAELCRMRLGDIISASCS